MRRVVFVVFVASCARAPVRAGEDAAAEPPAITDAGDPGALAAEARARKLAAARAAFDAGTWSDGELYATSARTSVMNVPAWPEESDGGAGDGGGAVRRLGYLRHGSHVPVFPEPIVNDDCAEGWFELIEGGFVCGKHATLDAKAPGVKFAASPPTLTAPMPYRYGYAVANDTPVYRRVLSLADRLKYEPWLAPPAPPPPPSPLASALSPFGAALDTSDNPYAEPKDAGVVKLGSLKGRGVLARKMMRGFYVALDRDFTAAKAKWWRTAEGFAIPFERLALQGGSPDFHGSWVARAPAIDAGVVAEGDGTAALVSSPASARFHESEDRPGAGAGPRKMIFTSPLPKWTALELAGEPKIVDGVAFRATTSGFFVRAIDLRIATPERPTDLAPGEKWIDVDLGREILVAFEGDHPVYATLVSSGRRMAWDPDHDHPTPTGTFRIGEKHVTATMDGDVVSDGPYSIEDVPWVMFFQGSYALHGAFWHNLFGTPRSHGCVNLSPIDARELFFWTEPRLPKGWHGVFGGAKGTRVVIHEPPPKK